MPNPRSADSTSFLVEYDTPATGCGFSDSQILFYVAYSMCGLWKTVDGCDTGNFVDLFSKNHVQDEDVMTYYSTLSHNAYGRETEKSMHYGGYAV